MDASVAAPPIPAAQRTSGLAVVASCFGWGLDLFDLFILLYVAPAVGLHFFPSHEPMLSLAGAYASFAVTLLMRPLGSALFGSYADRFGRKGAMIVAVAGVGLATASFGLLPTVEMIGLWATALFLVMRLVQGVFVGGVVASTHVIGTESVPERWRGMMSGMIGGGGAAIGTLFASIAFMVISNIFPGDAFMETGWRFMFFCGLITSGIGLVLFRGLAESPQFAQAQEVKLAKRKAAPAEGPSPLGKLFGNPDYRGRFFLNLLLSTGGGGFYYLTAGYLPTVLKLVNGLPGPAASTIMLLGAVMGAISSIALGELSQHIGRKKAFVGIGVVAIVALPLLAMGIGTATGSAVTWYALALSFLGSAGFAPLMIYLNERFPTDIRSTGTALSWNVGFAIGGIMPTFVSLAAKSPTDIPHVLSIFLGVLAAIYLVGAILTPETRGRLTV